MKKKEKGALSYREVINGKIDIDNMVKENKEDSLQLVDFINEKLVFLSNDNYDRFSEKYGFITGIFIFIIFLIAFIFLGQLPVLQNLGKSNLRFFVPIIIIIYIFSSVLLSIFGPMIAIHLLRKEKARKKRIIIEKIKLSEKLKIDPEGLVSFSEDLKDEGGLSIKKSGKISLYN